MKDKISAIQKINEENKRKKGRDTDLETAGRRDRGEMR